MIIELIIVGIVVSSCLAVLLDEAVYSVASLTCTFILVSILYALNGAIIAAVFQLTMGVGSAAVLFLISEALSEEKGQKNLLKLFFSAVFAALLIILPSIYLTEAIKAAESPLNVSFGEALWNLRAMDVFLQGLVIITIAIGIVIVLYEGRGEAAK